MQQHSGTKHIIAFILTSVYFAKCKWKLL